MDVVRERKKCFERYFSSEVERRRVNEEYAIFSASMEDFSSTVDKRNASAHGD